MIRKIKAAYNRLRYDSVCAVCNNKVNAYMPLNEQYAENARIHGYPHFGKGETVNIEQYSCPVCHCFDRERLYALYFTKEFEKLNKNKTYRLLDIAPSEALANFFFLKYPYITRRTADLMRENVDDKVDIENMDIYKNDSFDYFVCSHVLEHVKNPDLAMKELFRVLKQGGKGIVMVPIVPGINDTLEDPAHLTNAERWKHYGQEDHLRLFGKKDFVNRLKKAGFDVHQFGIDHFGKNAFIRNGLKKSSTLYVVEK